MGVTLRKRKLPSGKTQVYFDIYGYGKRWTESFGILPGDKTNNKDMLLQAEEDRAKRELELRANDKGLSNPRRRGMSFVKYMQDFTETKTAPNTKSSYKQALQQLTDFRGLNITFADLSTHTLEGFRSHLLKEVAPNSAQVYLARIKTVLHHAVNEGILISNPAASITIKKEEKLPVRLTIKEVRTLAKTPCPNSQVKAAFLFSCFSGLRYGDVDALTWDKVKDGFLEFSQKKTGTPERMPLSVQALKILRAQKRVKANPRLQRQRPKNCVFLLPSQPVLDKQLKKWALQAGIGKSISFHKARHTFATLSLSAGNDLYTTSKLLGHKNIQTTQIYAKVIDEKKRRAINKLPRL